MAGEAQVGPYIANLQIEERRREQKAHRFDALAEVPKEIEQTMFAWSEHNRMKAKDKASALTEAMKMYGGSDAPQSLVNEWGGSIEVASGVKLPKDPQGNIVPPPADALMDPEEKQYLRGLSPEQRHMHTARKFGDLPAAGKEEDLKWKNFWEAQKIRISEARLGIEAANSAKGAEMHAPSGWVLGEDGKPRRAKESENSLTFSQLKAMNGVMGLSAKSLDNEYKQLKIDSARKALNSGAADDKILLNLIGHMYTTKNYAGQRKLWVENLRPRMLRDGIDIGEPPEPVSMKDQIKEMLGIGSSRQRPTKPDMKKPDVPTVTPQDTAKLQANRDAAIARGDIEEAGRIGRLLEPSRADAAVVPNKDEINKLRLEAGLPPL